jgi:hypothetical protein
MSVNFLRLIPTEPNWVPANCEASAAIAVLRSVAPNSRAITTKTHDTVVFVDAGDNSESLSRFATAGSKSGGGRSR